MSQDEQREGEHMKRIAIEHKHTIIYSGITILCMLIYLIYNRFSHGVTSPYMTYLFCWPLLLGVIPSLTLTFLANAINKKNDTTGYRFPNSMALNLYNSGVAALTTSSLLRGIFDIAGNSSVYQKYLMVFGLIMVAASILHQAMIFMINPSLHKPS